MRFKTKVFVAAVVTPNVMTNAVANAGFEHERVQLNVRAEAAQQQTRPMLIAQARDDKSKSVQPERMVPSNPERAMSKRQAQALVRAELSKMTAAQRSKLGKSRAEVELIAVQSLAITNCCGHATQGVGCKGTTAFSNGVTCCALTIVAK